MKSMSLGAPQSTRSLSSFLVRVGKSTMTPGRLTFLRSLQSRVPSQQSQMPVQMLSTLRWMYGSLQESWPENEDAQRHL